MSMSKQIYAPESSAAQTAPVDHSITLGVTITSKRQPTGTEGIYSTDHLPRGGDLWVLGPPPQTSALPRSCDGLFEAPREAGWKTEPLRVREAAGSQEFKSLMLCAYGLTSPLLSHSTSNTKQEEEERTWNANHGIPYE